MNDNDLNTYSLRLFKRQKVCKSCAKVLQLFSEFSLRFFGTNDYFKQKMQDVHYMRRICISTDNLKSGIIRTCSSNQNHEYSLNSNPLNRFKGMLDLHMMYFNMYLYVYIQKYIQLLSIQSSHKIHWACRQIKRYLAQVGVDSEVTIDLEEFQNEQSVDNSGEQ